MNGPRARPIAPLDSKGRRSALPGRRRYSTCIARSIEGRMPRAAPWPRGPVEPLEKRRAPDGNPHTAIKGSWAISFSSRR